MFDAVPFKMSAEDDRRLSMPSFIYLPFDYVFREARAACLLHNFVTIMPVRFFFLLVLAFCLFVVTRRPMTPSRPFDDTPIHTIADSADDIRRYVTMTLYSYVTKTLRRRHYRYAVCLSARPPKRHYRCLLPPTIAMMPRRYSFFRYNLPTPI